MATGKKFDAAQKHFAKKEQILDLLIKCKSMENDTLKKEIQFIKVKNNELTSENERLKNYVERLLQYTELSQEDIKKACEKDKAVTGYGHMLNIIFDEFYGGRKK